MEFIGVYICTGTHTCHKSAQDLDGIVVFVIGSSKAQLRFLKTDVGQLDICL